MFSELVKLIDMCLPSQFLLYSVFPKDGTLFLLTLTKANVD